MTAKPRVVACPHCGKSVEWVPANAWRPFCSERCKLIDFGAWATEQYRMPVVDDPNEPDLSTPAEPPAR